MAPKKNNNRSGNAAKTSQSTLNLASGSSSSSSSAPRQDTRSPPNDTNSTKRTKITNENDMDTSTTDPLISFSPTPPTDTSLPPPTPVKPISDDSTPPTDTSIPPPTGPDLDEFYLRPLSETAQGKQKAVTILTQADSPDATQ